MCQEFRISLIIEKREYVIEFVFAQEFDRKKDAPQLTHISIHKLDSRHHIL